MILAQYTIRSKQEYIFRSNRLLDIVGGTEMIRDAFDWVFAAAEQEGVTCQPADVLFKLQAVQDAFAAGTLGMAELFRGGGNLTVLYRDRDTYLRVNRRFSRLVLENAPGMVPMAACCEANGQNYSADYSALMAAVDAEKNRMLPGPRRLRCALCPTGPHNEPAHRLPRALCGRPAGADRREPQKVGEGPTLRQAERRKPPAG